MSTSPRYTGNKDWIDLWKSNRIAGIKQQIPVGYGRYEDQATTPPITPSNTPTPTITPSGTPNPTPTPSITPTMTMTPSGLAPLLFNEYSTGKFAGYSLRLLDNTYTGDSIRVRRDSDQSELDIGFNGSGGLDTTALTNFCTGTTNGYITTWYDQSGNGYDMTQSIALSQYQIVSSGSVIVSSENSLPAALSVESAGNDNPDYYLADLGTASIATGNTSIYQVSERNGTAGSEQTAWIAGDPTQTNGVQNRGIPILQSEVQNVANSLGLHNTWISYTGKVVVDQGGTSTTEVFINNYDRSGTTLTITSKSTSVDVSNTGTQTWSSSTTGYNKMSMGLQGTIAGVSCWGGYTQELVVWNISQTSNHTGIKTNINNYYNVY